MIMFGLVFLFGIFFYTALSCQTNKPKNLKVLKDKDMTIEEMKEFMRTFTLSLGVECDYCHNKDNFSSDEKKEKLATREMMKMMDAMNDQFFKNAKEEVTCYTCHRGQVQIKNIPPGL